MRLKDKEAKDLVIYAQSLFDRGYRGEALVRKWLTVALMDWPFQERVRLAWRVVRGR